MRKAFFLAMTAVMLAGPLAFAGGGKKDGKQKSCNHCTKQNCTGKKCDDCCKGGRCPKA